MVRGCSIFLLPLLAAAQDLGGLKLASQSFNGNGRMDMKTKPPMPPMPPSIINVSLRLDMEAVRYRIDENIFLNMTQYNVTTNTYMSMIFDASTKRFTMMMDTETTGPAPKSAKTCSFGSFPTLHEPAVVGKCIQDAFASAKPEGSEDGLEKYVMHLPVGGTSTDPASETFFMDKDGVMKKLTLDMTVSGITEHLELADPDAKAGIPDASIFTPPADWGNCKEMPVPAPPTGMPSSLQALMKCVGIINDNHHYYAINEQDQVEEILI